MERTNFIKVFKFDDIYKADNYVDYYFKADKEIINEIYPGKYPEAVSTELCITKTYYTGEISASISPSREVENENSVEEYDWSDIEIDEKIMNAMINSIDNAIQ